MTRLLDDLRAIHPYIAKQNGASTARWPDKGRHAACPECAALISHGGQTCEVGSELDHEHRGRCQFAKAQHDLAAAIATVEKLEALAGTWERAHPDGIRCDSGVKLRSILDNSTVESGA